MTDLVDDAGLDFAYHRYTMITNTTGIPLTNNFQKVVKKCSGRGQIMRADVFSESKISRSTKFDNR